MEDHRVLASMPRPHQPAATIGGIAGGNDMEARDMGGTHAFLGMFPNSCPPEPRRPTPVVVRDSRRAGGLPGPT